MDAGTNHADICNRLAKEVAIDLAVTFGLNARSVKAFCHTTSEGKNLFAVAASGVLGPDKGRNDAVMARIKSVCDRPGFGPAGGAMIICQG